MCGPIIVPMSEHFFQYVLRLVFALLVGGLIGMEREIKGKAAGMRTNMLICMASCLLMILSVEVFARGTWFGDPTRIASQVVVGIGFLGAGMIIQSQFSIAGLTSAATIWFVAAIGLVVGWGDYALAAATTALVVITLTALDSIERFVAIKQRRHMLQFDFSGGTNRMADVKKIFMELRINPENIALKRGSKRVRVDLEYVASDKKHMLVVDAVRGLSDVEVLLDY